MYAFLTQMLQLHGPASLISGASNSNLKAPQWQLPLYVLVGVVDVIMLKTRMESTETRELRFEKGEGGKGSAFTRVAGIDKQREG